MLHARDKKKIEKTFVYVTFLFVCKLIYMEYVKDFWA